MTSVLCNKVRWFDIACWVSTQVLWYLRSATRLFTVFEYPLGIATNKFRIQLSNNFYLLEENSLSKVPFTFKIIFNYPKYSYIALTKCFLVFFACPCIKTFFICLLAFLSVLHISVLILAALLLLLYGELQ